MSISWQILYHNSSAQFSFACRLARDQETADQELLTAEMDHGSLAPRLQLTILYRNYVQ